MTRLSLVIASVMLASCTVAPKIDKTQQQLAWQTHQQNINALQQWQLNGRLAITRGVESYTLNIRWKQKSDSYEIFLSGPMSSGMVQLVGENHGGVVLRDAEKNVFHAEHPEQLLFEHTGVKMPVSGLRYWILGLPQPPSASVKSFSQQKYDSEGRLVTFTQKDWLIDYDGYTTVTNWQLPESMHISNEDEDVEVRIVIHR